MRPAARMLTVGVDTAAAVVNLHMVTRAGLQLETAKLRKLFSKESELGQ